MVELRTGLYGSYYGSPNGQSEPLSQEEMNVNAFYIKNYLTAQGWTINAIAGMLGNMQAESTINPGRWQNDNVGSMTNGYGLVQWTPATKYFNWLNESAEVLPVDVSEMDNNLSRILYELKNNIQWIATSSYNFSFEEFSKSNLSVSELAKAFLLNYERPADQSIEVQNYRASLSEAFYTLITGEQPDNPHTPKKTKKKFNFLLFNARKRRNLWIR